MADLVSSECVSFVEQLDLETLHEGDGSLCASSLGRGSSAALSPVLSSGNSSSASGFCGDLEDVLSSATAGAAECRCHGFCLGGDAGLRLGPASSLGFHAGLDSFWVRPSSDVGFVLAISGYELLFDCSEWGLYGGWLELEHRNRSAGRLLQLQE